MSFLWVNSDTSYDQLFAAQHNAGVDLTSVLSQICPKRAEKHSCGLCTKQHNATCKMSYAKVEDDSSLAFLCHLFLTEWCHPVISTTVSADEPTVDYDLRYCVMLTMQSQHMARAKVAITMLRHLNPVAQFGVCDTCPLPQLS